MAFFDRLFGRKKLKQELSADEPQESLEKSNLMTEAKKTAGRTENDTSHDNAEEDGPDASNPLMDPMTILNGVDLSDVLRYVLGDFPDQVKKYTELWKNHADAETLEKQKIEVLRYLTNGILFVLCIAPSDCVDPNALYCTKKAKERIDFLFAHKGMPTYAFHHYILIPEPTGMLSIVGPDRNNYIACFSTEKNARETLNHYREVSPECANDVVTAVYIEDFLREAGSRYGAILDMPNPMPLDTNVLLAVRQAHEGKLVLFAN